MISANIPSDEEERLRALFTLDILDTLEEQAYDDLTKLAAEICGTPIALVSLVDRDRQWFKSHHGLDARETPREVAFCSHAILSDELFVIEDSSKDERFFDNPLVTSEPYVKFYAGAPLILNNSKKLGTLCVIAHEPNTLSHVQKESLKALARQVVSQLELRLKIKDLKMLDHLKDEFIAMVSHELRTPLTAIYGSLSLLLNKTVGQLNDDQNRMIDVSYRNADRLLSLVNDILDLAKLESGKMDLQMEELNVVALLEKSIELNEQYCISCETIIELHCDGSSDDFVVNGDEQRLLQVVSNLVSNAAKFTFKNDVIEIYINNENGYVVVSVTDHGAGIREDQKELLFKKFQQVGVKGNNKLPGTGLGLNISKKIIEQHNGTIGFDSVPNVKTTFYFKIPSIKSHGASTQDNIA